MKNAAAALLTLDADGDGRLTEAELRPEPAGMQVSSAMLLYDLNDDGRISIQEFVRQPGQMSFFTAVDRNHDGYMSADELLVFFRAAERNRPGQR